MSRAIQAIDKRSVHRICSGQVVLDLATAVKELVENSLDAGASSIEIKLKEYGGDLVEVSDNGSGVSPDNYQGLTLKYYTSKISDFSDLQSLTSFGFRGEALSSLCALSDVSILTKTKEDSTGTRLTYDHSGLLISQEYAARQVGTTVYVSKLFSPLPVRHKEFMRNIRREYGRLVSVLQAYALISKNVRLVCTNQVGKSTRSTVLRTQGSNSIKENIVTIFGPKTVACLDPIDIKITDDLRIEGFVSKPGSGSGRGSGDRQFFYVNRRPVEMQKINKLLNELYKSFNSQQYPMAVLNFTLPTTAYDVNVTPDKRKLFLHAESSFISGLREALGSLYAPDKYSFPVHEVEEPSQKVFLADLQTQVDLEDAEEDSPGQEYGSPGKVHQEYIEAEGEDDLPIVSGRVHQATCSLSYADVETAEIIGDSPKVPVKVPEADDAEEYSPKKCKSVVDLSAFKFRSFTSSKTAFTETKKSSPIVQGKLTSFIKRKNVVSELLSEEPVLKKCKDYKASSPNIRKSSSVNPSKLLGSTSTVEREKQSNDFLSEEPLLKKRKADDEIPSGKVELEDDEELEDDGVDVHEDGGNLSTDIKTKTSAEQTVDGDETTKVCNEESSEDDDLTRKTPDEIEELSPQKDQDESSSQEVREIGFDIGKIRIRIHTGLIQYNRNSPQKQKCRSFTAATVRVDSIKGQQEKEAVLQSATRELERSFSKEDFNRMKVVGQFNLGFIIARLDNDLFIIDQHASDEKYNFERLSKTTILNKQPLFRPLPLNLSAAEEIIISTHMDIFRRNGFDFTEQDDALPGQRILLSAVPFSKNITFGIPDVQELVSLVSDEASLYSSGNHVRPSRVHAMLASRACRSSIMIGDALSKKEMEKVVSHLADLDAPWNCPHGRPTMRHLFDLSIKKRQG